MRTGTKRVLGMLLAVLMVIGMMPAAYADGEETEVTAEGLTPLEFSESDDTVDAKLHLTAPDSVPGGVALMTQIRSVSRSF